MTAAEEKPANPKALPRELTDLNFLYGFVAPDLICRIKAEGMVVDAFLAHTIQGNYFNDFRCFGRHSIDLVLRACRTQEELDDAWARISLAPTRLELRPREPDDWQ